MVCQFCHNREESKLKTFFRHIKAELLSAENLHYKKCERQFSSRKDDTRWNFGFM